MYGMGLMDLKCIVVMESSLRGHNVRTCPVKKADVEGDMNSNRRTTKKKHLSRQNYASHPAATPATGEEEIIDPEQIAHEEYLDNLFDWMNDIYRIQHVPQTLPAIP
ncbi:hypothetical protein LIER_14076 [Lithospermum erythrorhizon]|uniref:Uncharacterized protein n=1 Tax=Lithospermum erythrorhizon TaxID=34254 RepID=A0AAV3PYS0_LITER